MAQIIRQLSLIIAVGVISLSLGCGIDDFIADLKDELEDGEEFAPTSLAGRTLNHTISGGSGDAASSGSFTISYYGTTYNLTDTGGTMANETGTYTYTKRANDEAKIVMVGGPDPLQNTYEIVLSFTSHTSGSYRSSQMNGDSATQTGTFTLRNEHIILG